MRQKAKVWIVRSSEKSDFARWPCEALDLKEIRDEVSWLAMYNLMLKSNPEDREVVKIIALKLYWGRELTFKEKADDVIDDENEFGKDVAAYFSRATEMHRVYQKTRFLFYATSE